MSTLQTKKITFSFHFIFISTAENSNKLCGAVKYIKSDVGITALPRICISLTEVELIDDGRDADNIFPKELGSLLPRGEYLQSVDHEGGSQLNITRVKGVHKRPY